MSTEIAVEGEMATAPDVWGHPRPLWMLLIVTAGFNYALYGFRAYLAPRKPTDPPGNIVPQ